ncbi:MAG: MFS transporter [Gammaproteobacteria bacterium]|nr:MFS transporter [Gammaproteobacteria bacterium]
MLKFLRHNFRWVIGGFTLTFFSSFGQTYFISISISEWREIFDLSHGEFGRLYMFATLASAACLPFLGKLIDFIPPHKLIVMVIPILSAAAILAGIAPSIWALIIAIFFLRLFGQGLMSHIALTTTGRWFSAERGRAISLVILGHQGGEASMPLVFSMVAIIYGYEVGWFFGAILLLIIALPISFWAYSAPRELQGSNVSSDLSENEIHNWTRREVMSDPIFWILLTGALAPGFIGTIIFYHQNYLTEINEWPPQIFVQSLIVLSTMTVIFTLISGAIVNKFGSRILLPYFLIPLVIACFLLTITGPAIIVTGVMIFLGISYGISWTLFGSLWPEIYGTKYLGSVRSITISAVVIATAAGPGVTGTLIDSGISLQKQMNYIGIYCLITLVAMIVANLFLRKRIFKKG